MYGWINGCLEDLVIKNYGDETWQLIKEVACIENPTTGEFFRSCYYSDESTIKLVSTAAAILNKSATELLELFGHHFVHYLDDHGYSRTLRCQGETFREWIRNVNEPHRLLRSRLPLSSFPEFWLEDVPSDLSGDSVILHYSSSRIGGLAPVVVGIIKEAAKYFFNLEISMDDFEGQQCPITNKYRGRWVISGLNSEVPQISKSSSSYSSDPSDLLANYQISQSTNILDSKSQDLLNSTASEDLLGNDREKPLRKINNIGSDISQVQCPFHYYQKPPNVSTDNTSLAIGGIENSQLLPSENATSTTETARKIRSTSVSSTSSDFSSMSTKFNQVNSGLSSRSAPSQPHKAVNTQSIGVNGTVLKRIFPFHIVINKELQVIQVGNKMKRFIQKQWKMHSMLQCFVGDHFQITLPNHFLWTWEGLQNFQHMSIEMTLTSTLVNTAGQHVDLKFRGEVVLIDKNGNCHPYDDDADDEEEADEENEDVFGNIGSGVSEEDIESSGDMSPFNSKPSSSMHNISSESHMHRHCSFHNKKGQCPMSNQRVNILPYSHAVFLINPDIASMDELLSLQLKLSDLPRHSFQSDLLLIDEHLKTETSYAIKLQEISNSLDMESRKAKEALKMKRIFVRYVSHEIRTPLNIAILGLKCLEQELSQQQEESHKHSLQDYPVILTSNDDTNAEDVHETRNFLPIITKSKMSTNELTTPDRGTKIESHGIKKDLSQKSASCNLALLPTSSQRSLFDSPATTPRLSSTSSGTTQCKNVFPAQKINASHQISYSSGLEELHLLTKDPDEDNFFETLDENDVYEECDEEGEEEEEEEEEEEMERSLVETVLDEIKTSCTIAVDILNDLLLYEKIDNGVFDIAKQATYLYDMLDESVKLFRIQAKGADIHFVTNDYKMIACADRDPPFIYGFQLSYVEGIRAGNTSNVQSMPSHASLSSFSSAPHHNHSGKFNTRHHRRHSHHHHRQFHNAAKSPISIIATLDHSKIQQVLRNLFTNAVKFTPSGGRVTLSYAIFGPEDILHEHFNTIPLQNLSSQQRTSPMTHIATNRNTMNTPQQNLSLFYSPSMSVTGTPASTSGFSSSSSVMHGVSTASSSCNATPIQVTTTYATKSNNSNNTSGSNVMLSTQNTSKPSTPRVFTTTGSVPRITNNYSYSNMNNNNGDKKIIFAENIDDFGPCFARIAITDTGPGISAADQATLFHEFIQVKANKLQNGQGSGLGLWIAATIMKMHGGRIGVASAGEGYGSVFLVDIPIDIIHDSPSCTLPSSTSSSSSFISLGSHLSSSSSVSMKSLSGSSKSSSVSTIQLTVPRKPSCASSSSASPIPPTMPTALDVNPSMDNDNHPRNLANDIHTTELTDLKPKVDASIYSKDQEDSISNFIIEEEAHAKNSFSALLVKVEAEIERPKAFPSVHKSNSMQYSGPSFTTDYVSGNVCMTPNLSVSKRQDNSSTISVNNKTTCSKPMVTETPSSNIVPNSHSIYSSTSLSFLPNRETSSEGKDFLLSLTSAERARFISLAPERLRAQHQPGIATLLQRSECFQQPSQSLPISSLSLASPSSKGILKRKHLSSQRESNTTIDSTGNNNSNIISELIAKENLSTFARAEESSKRNISETIDRSKKTKRMSEARILIVDDAASNRKMVCRLLQRQFPHLEEAENGLVAIEKFTQSFVVLDDNTLDTSKAINVILMDFMMPLMNGPDATKEIKRLAMEQFHNHPIVVIGVTGNGLPEDIAMFIQHGADEVMVKPLDYEKLLKFLQNHPIFAEKLSTIST